MKLISVAKPVALAVLALAVILPGPAAAQSAAGVSAAPSGSDPAKATSGFPMDKGSAFVGLNFDYGSTKKENIESLLEEVIYSNVKDGSLLLNGGWFFKENAAVGLGLSLGKTSSVKETPNLFGPTTVTESTTRLTQISPFIRYYLPMGGGNRFYLLTQVELVYAHESGDESETTGDNSTMSTLTKNSYGLGFTPGVVVVVVRGFALEVTVGVGGIKYGVEKRKQEGAPDGVIKTTNFDLKIDLLKLTLGFSYYF